MKRVAILMAVLALAAACDDDSPTKPSNTGPIVFTAQLSAANEVPPITNAESTARGTTTITFNVPRDSNGNPSGGGTVTFGIQLNSFPTTSPAVIAAHIHPGAAGVNGSPLVDTRVSQAAPIVLTNGAANYQHHRRHFAGQCDEHRRGAGELLLQRAHPAEYERRGEGAAGAGAAIGTQVRGSRFRGSKSLTGFRTREPANLDPSQLRGTLRSEPRPRYQR